MPIRILPKDIKPTGRTLLVQRVPRRIKAERMFLPENPMERTTPFVAKVLRAGNKCEVVVDGDYVLVTGWACKTASGSVDFHDGSNRMLIDEQWEVLATISYDEPSDLLKLAE